jgi:hypothetical protein
VDRLGLQVVVQALGPALATYAGLLEAAEGCLGSTIMPLTMTVPERMRRAMA